MSFSECGALWVQAEGNSEWWRVREAALLAVGAVAEAVLEVQAQQEQPALDIPALLHNVLHQDLTTPNTPPFLTGRALWMAARSGPGLLIRQLVHVHWTLWKISAS